MEVGLGRPTWTYGTEGRGSATSLALLLQSPLQSGWATDGLQSMRHACHDLHPAPDGSYWLAFGERGQGHTAGTGSVAAPFTSLTGASCARHRVQPVLQAAAVLMLRVQHLICHWSCLQIWAWHGKCGASRFKAWRPPWWVWFI